MTLSVSIPATYPLRRDVVGMYGLSEGEGQQIAMQAVSSAGSIAIGTAPLWATTTTTAASGATTVAMASWAIPVIGAAVAGVTLALVAWFNRKGPKQKVQTTAIVNELEPMLQENLRAYENGPHTRASQAQALANFDAVWATLVDNCRTEQYGDPGIRCVEDRDAGSCEWKDAAGQCWNWWSGYRDPIANDPNVQPDPVLNSAGELVNQLTGGLFQGSAGGGLGWLLAGGALLVLALTMGRGNK